MNFIDLCAGIGGIRLGLEQAGHKCVGFCEFDKFALQSYKAIHNTEGEWEGHDITKITDDEIRELAASRKIDIITGGFPCQAFSVAGHRKGFDDTRGTIFFEIARFIKIIQPRYFICENVKGLLSHDGGKTFGVILEAMAELGYCVEWQILNSKDYGVPQNRERVFLIGHLGNGSGGKVFPIFPTDGENPCRMQELTQGQSMGSRVYDPKGLCKTLSALGGGGGAKTGLYIVRPVLTPDRDKRQNGPRMKGENADFYTLNTQDRHGIAIFEKKQKEVVRIRKLTPRECWRLQGFPDEYFDRAKATDLSDAQLYKQAGNAVTVNVAAVIGKRLAEIERDKER